MGKVKFRPFWSYDVLKTQEWLDKMNQLGYRLKKVNKFLRLFHFEKGTEEKGNYIISYEKGINGFPERIKESIEYDTVCYTNNFYFVKSLVNKPSFVPSYELILNRNQKIKYIVGSILLFEILMSIVPTVILFYVLFFGEYTVTEVELFGEPTYTWIEIAVAIFNFLAMVAQYLLQFWMIYTFFRLQSSNKKLEHIYLATKRHSSDEYMNTIYSKEEIKQLRKDNKLIRKIKIAWHYSPDTVERWLEEMELQGFNLIRMSKIGNSFYFKRGNPRKMKYHVDYQNKKNVSYFSINEESGWTLYFTTLSSYFSISVFGKIYDDIEPEYYSDIESKEKHARRYMLSFAVPLLIISIMYFFIVSISINNVLRYPEDYSSVWQYITPSIFFLVGIEFMYFSVRLIRYYIRVRNKERLNF